MIGDPDEFQVKVGIPRGRFVLHPDPSRFVHVALSLYHDEWWLLHPEPIKRHTIDAIHDAHLFEGLDGNGCKFVLPVAAPTEYKSDWHESLYEVIDLARHRWVVVEEDLQRSRFNVVPSPQLFPARLDWGNYAFEELLAIAFADRYIDTWADIAVNFLDAPAAVPPKVREDREERMRSLLKPR